ncbi:hypothetical protein [Paucibacter sp. KCTC 42545]|uniref:hypothetical protein n=1 Tax=Paucibacter sp. KCTC 42545 TaxID=1768242 RepID=UPI0009E8BFAD|nr:hypothetical protein [Paucibacter sp. KCTC 42545]
MPANPNFSAFIEQAEQIASDAGFHWDMRVNAAGNAAKGFEWDLRRMSNDGRPKKLILRTFTECEDALQVMERRGILDGSRQAGPVSKAWQDLIKAYTIEHVRVRKKSIPYISQAAAALRFVATISRREPWETTAEDLRLACEISDELQPSRGRTIVILGFISSVVDPLHLFNACPLSGLLSRPEKMRAGRARFAQTTRKLAKTLAERKAEEKLPERRAFWELVRIVFTEKPRTFNDALRFAMIKVLLFTGLRVGEVAHLPLDWKRTRAYVDDSGRPAGELGGISETLSIRHFAEKQDNNKLYEETQFVPDMFREQLESTLDEIAALTAPLRATLKAQYESGRIFPMYAPDQLVDSVEMYVRMSGNPVWAATPSAEVEAAISRYADSFDARDLADLQTLQASTEVLSAAVSRYFTAERRGLGLIPRRADGSRQDRGIRGSYLRISEVEAFVAAHQPTKISDLSPLLLDNGTTIAPWEMLFLMPKRAVGAGRGDTVIDPLLMSSIGIADEALVQLVLGADDRKAISLFTMYGQSDEDRKLSIKSHAFRHLQNTELFRLGVADTIISKRFNRRSVAQSYDYDHRSLAEELDQIELPEEWELMIGPSKAATVAKMIQAGRANGPIVREFKNIQAKEGDEAALRFLATEADGFHATPYGTCLNSFTVDPCPKHLECFSGCRHLSATNLPEHQDNILKLHGRLKIALESAQARPDGTVGKANQIAHAMERIKGVEALMTTLPGQSVFPDGKDLSETSSTQRQSVLHGA